MANSNHQVVWEHRQAELWDRMFQASQDTVAFAETVADTGGTHIVREALVRSALGIGAAVVRANAADDRAVFIEHVTEARLRAIETDYWLRMAYTLQQREEQQRDVSGLLSQYAAIIDLLHTFAQHAKSESSVIARHTRGPRVS